MTSRNVTMSLGLAWQKHSVAFSTCQVLFHKFYREIIAEDRAYCALPSVFCVSGERK